MHINNDIHEKLTVSLWAVMVLSLIITLCVVCNHKKSSDANLQQAEVQMAGEADDFEGEFLEPKVAQVTQPRLANKPQRKLVEYQGKYFSYGKKFSDRNDRHLAAAQYIGLSNGPQNRAAAEKMGDQLREIKTNRYYVVEDLTHSLPYLVPTAAARLDSIGVEFADILARNDLPAYRFRVTSVLRSQEDIRRLQRCNANSISNSPHNYGTTFDIGYAHFDQITQTTDSMTDDNLKLVLAQTLLNQQRAGHIYVKYEHKQGCFHITARN